ncbi:hypothetical protein GCM10010446_52810 [Streptomyces enissocaesilis]|uniref:Uncharacterized protein n=2 Tax=Streptomyces enissocaesilis TaxID=332589 RepID=A0ABP6K1F7_9ACTN
MLPGVAHGAATAGVVAAARVGCMTSDLWASLPAAVREKVDELVVQGRSVQAVFAIRSSGVTPRPGLRACQDVIAERGVVLADRFDERGGPDEADEAGRPVPPA